jgi:hypothetical protein
VSVGLDGYRRLSPDENERQTVSPRCVTASQILFALFAMIRLFQIVWMPVSLPPTPDSMQEAICRSMLHNSAVFLRKAAEEIGHCNTKNQSFDVDRATLVTVLIQTAVELASTAVVIRHDGLASVMRGDAPQNDREAETRWRAGKIKTQSFEEIKERSAELFGDEDFWGLIDDFQTKRNKLVHFNLPLEDDLFDLQYDTTHVLIEIISILSEIDDRIDLPRGCVFFLGQELFDNLMAFKPYRSRIEQLADQKIFRCIVCDVRAYSPDLEKCLACGYDGEINLIVCPHCRERALFYDHLNLPYNSSLCGACGGKARVAHCSACKLDYALDLTAPLCCPWADDHE